MNTFLNKKFSENKDTFLRELLNFLELKLKNSSILYIGAKGESLYKDKKLFEEMVAIYKGDEQKETTYFMKFKNEVLIQVSEKEFDGYNFQIKCININTVMDNLVNQNYEVLDIFFGALSNIKSLSTPKMNMIVRTKGLITSKMKKKYIDKLKTLKVIKRVDKEKAFQLIKTGIIKFPINTNTNINIKLLEVEEEKRELEILEKRITLLETKI